MIEVEHATDLYRWISRPYRALKNVSLMSETGELVTGLDRQVPGAST
jgi:hypothetical protein